MASDRQRDEELERLREEVRGYRSREGERSQTRAALGVFLLLIGIGYVLSFFI